MKAIDIAKMIDHSLLHPTLTDDQLFKGCELAKTYHTASVCIKPYSVLKAAEWLAGSDVLVSTTVGFPHGSHAISTKVYETRKAFDEGAIEIDMVVNIGKVLQEDWDYVTQDIQEVLTVTQGNNGILKVIFENDHLPKDSFKIRLCEICSDLGVDFIKTSTGFGFNKTANGLYDYHGATLSDLRLMAKHASKGVQIKAAGKVRSLDQLLEVRKIGVSRVGLTATAQIMNDAYERFGGVSPGMMDTTKGY